MVSVATETLRNPCCDSVLCWVGEKREGNEKIKDF